MPEHYAAFEELRSLTHEQVESNSENVWELKKNAFAGPGVNIN